MNSPEIRIGRREFLRKAVVDHLSPSLVAIGVTLGAGGVLRSIAIQQEAAEDVSRMRAEFKKRLETQCAIKQDEVARQECLGAEQELKEQFWVDLERQQWKWREGHTIEKISWFSLFLGGVGFLIKIFDMDIQRRKSIDSSKPIQ